MNEETAKLEKIKKSSHAGKIVTRILFIMAVIGAIAAIAAGSIILSMGKEFDNAIEQATEQGIVEKGKDYIGKAKLFGFDIGDPSKIDTDIQSLRDALDDHPMSIAFGVYLLIMGFIVAVAAVLMKLVESVFALLEQAESPFSDKVRRRVTVTLVVTTVILFFTNGAALGLLGMMVSWVVYTILDYGKTLQIQSDETL